MEGLAEGRIVHAVIKDRNSEFQHRPAVIVRVWNQETGTINLQIFTDGLNDGEEYASGIYWGTSYVYDPNGTGLMTWHWPEKV